MSEFRLRILAAACGSLVSLLLAIVGAITIIFGIIGLVGIPVGAVLGFAVGPRLSRATSQKRIVLATSVLALPLGVGLYAVIGAIGESGGASIFDLVKYVFTYGLAYGAIGAVYGFPMALIVAVIAASLFRRNVERVDRLWKPATLVVGIVAALTVGALAAAALNPGTDAARVGQQVQLTYRVDNLSNRDFMLDIRSYWNGEAIGGSSGYVASGVCTSYGSGDELNKSDWAIWLSGPDSNWTDRPAGNPVVTNATYGQTGDVRLTIVIDPDGRARVIPGVEACPEP